MQMTLDFVNNCIDDAENLHSKLPVEISERPGLSSRKIRHLLNNLCSVNNCKYLNVGLCTGSTFWSAIYHNHLLATGIDWFRNDTNKDGERDFYKNLSYVINLETETLDRKLEIYNQNCFTAELNHKYNIYLYDAGHSFEDQYNALQYFDKYLEDRFIFLVDDFDDYKVKTGTIKAINDIGYGVEFFCHRPGQFGNWNPASDTWWNGFLISILKKCN